MQTAFHFFKLPTAYDSIELLLEIAFQNETLYKLHFAHVNINQKNKGDWGKLFPPKKNIVHKTPHNLQNSTDKTEPFACRVFIELAEYFMGQRTAFTIPFHAEGTEFQKSVWKELVKIPYGETCSYKDIATRIHNEKACRAVGLANNRNPLAIFIPCHRVIGANGSLMGYAGQVPVKAALLQLENMKRACLL